MYIGVISQSNWLLHITCLNSFIHTVMYAYFAAATLGYKSKYAQVLTSMQLGQFFLGIILSVFNYWFQCHPSPLSLFGLVFMHAYAVGLIILFFGLYREKYSKKGSTKKTK